MSGRDLLCAIAETDDGIVLASGEFSAVESSIKADRKRIRQRFTAIGITAVICIAVFGVVKFAPRSFHLFTPSDTTELQTPGGNDPSETGDIAAVTEPRTTGDEKGGTTPSGEQDTSAVRETALPSSTTDNHMQTEPTGKEEPAPSDPPAPPVTEPVNPVRIGFKVNKINHQISAAPKYYSPEAYDTLYWSYEEISGYYGVDYRSVLNEIGFSTDAYNEYKIIADKNGNMAYDNVSFLYTNSEGSSVKLSASKIALPYDSIYELESNETNTIQGTDVLIGGFPAASDPDSYVFFYADFEKNNVHYRVTGNHISDQQFYKTIERIILQ